MEGASIRIATHRNPSVMVASPPQVPGAGYSPGTDRRLIRYLLTSYRPNVTHRITGEIYKDEVPVLSNIIAILRREEGIGRAWDL